MTKILINKMGRNLYGQLFIGVFYTAETSAIVILLSLFVKLFLWNDVNGGLVRLYSNIQHITMVFRLQSQNKYLWIELKT